MSSPTPPPDPDAQGSPLLDSLNPFSDGFGLPGLVKGEGGIGAAVAPIFGPLTEMFAASKAGLYNTLNQIFNSVFYAVVAGAGFLVMVYGIWTLAKEVPGVGGLESAIGGLARTGGKIAGLAAIL